VKLVRRHPSTSASAREQALIPLINVVFLMLIFFMVVGRLVPSELFAVEPPSARVGTTDAPGASSDSWMLLVSADGRLALNGQAITTEALAARLRAAGAGQGLPELILRADGALNTATLRALLERLRAVGLQRIQLVTIPVR
jgi:biopolymer transport protein ExbD